MVHITDILYEVTPKRGQRGDRFALTWDNLNRDTIGSASVGDNDLAIGEIYSYGEVRADGFDAAKWTLDIRAQNNSVFVSDNGAFVYDFIARESDSPDGTVSDQKLETAAGTALTEASRQGKIEGLRPVDDRAPPATRVAELSELDERIDAIHLAVDEGEDPFVPYVVPAPDVSSTEARQAVRMVGGVTYPQPERVKIVQDESEFPSD